MVILQPDQSQVVCHVMFLVLLNETLNLLPTEFYI